MSQFPEKKKITSEDNSVTTSGRAIPVGAHELRVVETSAILDVGGVHTHIHTQTHGTQGSRGFARLSVQTRVKSLLVSRTVSPAVVRRGCRGLTSNLAWIRGGVYSAASNSSNGSTRLLVDG